MPDGEGGTADPELKKDTKKQVKSQYVLIVVGVLTLVVILVLRNRSASSSTANSGIDPNTGLPYSQELANAYASAGYGGAGTVTGGGGSMVGPSGDLIDGNGNDLSQAYATLEGNFTQLQQQLAAAAQQEQTDAATAASQITQLQNTDSQLASQNAGLNATLASLSSTVNPLVQTTPVSQSSSGSNSHSEVTVGGVKFTPTSDVGGHYGVGNAQTAQSLENAGVKLYKDINGNFVLANSAAGKASSNKGLYT